MQDGDLKFGEVGAGVDLEIVGGRGEDDDGAEEEEGEAGEEGEQHAAAGHDGQDRAGEGLGLRVRNRTAQLQGYRPSLKSNTAVRPSVSLFGYSIGASPPSRRPVTVSVSMPMY
jgi:hypothetical protein